MDRDSDKHGPRVDDGLDRMHDNRTPTREAESVDRHHEAPEGTLSPEEIEMRTALAQAVPHSAFPAKPAQLLETAQEMEAEPEVLSTLRRLPDHEYRNLQEVWATLGGTTEDRET